jgi:hypothetical protein
MNRRFPSIPDELEHVHNCHACEECYVPAPEAAELLARLLKRHAGLIMDPNGRVQQTTIRAVARIYADRHNEDLETVDRALHRLNQGRWCHVRRDFYDQLWVLL